MANLNVGDITQINNSIGFKAERSKRQYQPAYQTPMSQDEIILRNMMKQQKKKERSSKIKSGISWGLGILASAVIVGVFGKQLYKEIKSENGLKKMKESLEKSVKESENKGKDVSKTVASLENKIINCKDPVLKRAAMNEYEKGPYMMSKKRINEILSLDDLKNAKPEEIDLHKAIEIMDKKIVGMEEVKEEILDFLVQQNYCIRNGIKNDKPLVLLLNGPAGTGKTTISEVLAESMGMHYKKISLAGATGKAPIKGFEAVYTGASSGGIAQGQLEGRTRRVLYCLDEVEKSGSNDHNGRVEDTLLSLFDDQAKFVDDNLDVPIDISQSIFVLTSNDASKLSQPLQNRVRKIEIKPYGKDIKTMIARLKLNQMLEKYKLDPSKVKLHESACSQLADMTSDQGGRETSRNVDTIIKKLIDIVQLQENSGVINLDAKFVKDKLGPVKGGSSIKTRILNASKHQE